MPDDKSKPGRSDRDRINLEQEHDVRDWSRSLGAPEQELRHAVQVVGNNAATVREYLRSQKGLRP